MNIKWVEVAVGLFVAAGIAALFMLGMKVSNIGAFSVNNGYTVKARFENVGGLKEESPVSIGGVRIGKVVSISYDQNALNAEVTMLISSEVNRLPTDTAASIYTSGLLGEQYIGLEPGGEERYLSDGSEITLTQSALVIEQVVGKLLFSKAAE